MSDLTPEQRRRLEASLEPTRTVQILNLADVTPRNPKFLWYPYMPLGKLVIVAGAPGNGKSQLAALIAAMATRGSLYPGDVAETSRVCMMCAEDDLDDTVVPRLLAVNADLRLIDTINVKTDYPNGLTSTGMIGIPGDVDSVHRWAREHAPIGRLVVMDPVASFFDRDHNALYNQDVRDALGPLVAIAQKYLITVVIILHLNKSESRDFAAKIAESHGFQALARSVMALGPDPDDPEGNRGSRKVLAITKANLVKPGSFSMRCEVRSVTLSTYTPPIETSELALIGKCDISADDLLMPSAERSERNAKREWLDDFLDGGWRKQDDVKKAAISDGWSWKQIDHFARSRGYQRQKVKFQGKSWMGAPNADTRAIPESVDSLDSLDSFGDAKNPKESKESKESGYTRGDSYNGHNSDDLNQLDLDEYRKLRDRMLGERDDDEEDAS
jgi:hypothetical protein